MDNRLNAKLNEEEMAKVTGGVMVNGEDIGSFNLSNDDGHEDPGSVNVTPIHVIPDPSIPYKISSKPKKPW